MKSSWSINDFPPDEGEEQVEKEPVVLQRPLTSKEKEAIRFAMIRNRPDRKGRGSRRRNRELRWATKGK
jgi:hypothetical protein